MKETEIRERINSLYQDMVDSIPKDTFILDPKMGEINKEIERLQKLCKKNYGHNYKNGKCQWCDMMEE